MWAQAQANLYEPARHVSLTAAEASSAGSQALGSCLPCADRATSPPDAPQASQPWPFPRSLMLGFLARAQPPPAAASPSTAHADPPSVPSNGSGGPNAAAPGPSASAPPPAAQGPRQWWHRAPVSDAPGPSGSDASSHSSAAHAARARGFDLLPPLGRRAALDVGLFAEEVDEVMGPLQGLQWPSPREQRTAWRVGCRQTGALLRRLHTRPGWLQLGRPSCGCLSTRLHPVVVPGRRRRARRSALVPPGLRPGRAREPRRRGGRARRGPLRGAGAVVPGARAHYQLGRRSARWSGHVGWQGSRPAGAAAASWLRGAHARGAPAGVERRPGAAGVSARAKALLVPMQRRG
jgi:hypothetical protein